MISNPIILQNRSVISVSGEDKSAFLQGLITNDINKAKEDRAIYALMLSPVGKFLYDFFILRRDEKFLLDCSKERVDEIVQKLSFYKLRSKVEIKKEPDLSVIVSTKNEPSLPYFVDPRNSKMGYRAFVEVNKNFVANDEKYNLLRLALKIPDDSDMGFDKSFPLEFGFDDLNAIDYQKGCYIGQEVTARTHYKGVIRKKVFLVEILDCKIIGKFSEIIFEDKKIGEILSSILYHNQMLALALIKNIDNDGKEIGIEKLGLVVEGNDIKVIY
ncbi:MAG: aminomethyl transferase family protein [Rickettsiaceae bacterium]|jgi:folate-binding protein YgfZ|nr:aminomethyl transferase family protein [Rickettsiaceae bacterium]